MNKIYSEIRYCYKLNADIVKKLTRRSIQTSSRKTFPGASKLQILSMIYFSHVCSVKGDIECFSINDLMFALRCSKASVYNILKDLEDKEFITVENIPGFYGLKRIHIINNDFSDEKNCPRYLNTNHPFFDNRIGEGYTELCNMSLFSLRLFLNLLLNYIPKSGTTVSIDTLCSRINVKSRSLIIGYLDEIKNVLRDQAIHVFKIPKSRIRYGNLFIPKEKQSLAPEEQLMKHQESYYKNHWRMKLLLLGIELEGSVNSVTTRLSGLVTHFLKKKLSIQLIENGIENVLRSRGTLSESVYSEIYENLFSLCL